MGVRTIHNGMNNKKIYVVGVLLAGLALGKYYLWNSQIKGFGAGRPVSLSPDRTALKEQSLLGFSKGGWPGLLSPDRKADRKVLKVLTYSSFAGVYGPGRIIKEKFEKFCECEVQWFLAEDSTALLQRFLLVPGIDVVIGWDQISLPVAEEGRWENLQLLKTKLFQKGWMADKMKNEEGSFFQNPKFVPINWSPVGFIYRNPGISPPRLKSLHQVKGKISFPEPKTSTLGLQFYYWIYEAFQGDTKQIHLFLRKLKNKIYGPVFSWSLAYGFFQKGQSDMGLSYLSSLLYHQKEEPDKAYFFAHFQEGHPYQVEFVSVSRSSANRDPAFRFVEFLLSQEIQGLLKEIHYMFPVTNRLSFEGLLNLEQVELISYGRLAEFIYQKKSLMQLWEDNLY